MRIFLDSPATVATTARERGAARGAHERSGALSTAPNMPRPARCGCALRTVAAATSRQALGTRRRERRAGRDASGAAPCRALAAAETRGECLQATHPRQADAHGRHGVLRNAPASEPHCQGDKAAPVHGTHACPLSAARVPLLCAPGLRSSSRGACAVTRIRALRRTLAPRHAAPPRRPSHARRACSARNRHACAHARALAASDIAADAPCASRIAHRCER